MQSKVDYFVLYRGVATVLLICLRICLIPVGVRGSDAEVSPSPATAVSEPTATDAPVVFGPLPLRNLSALTQIFYYPVAERTRTLARSQWRWSTNMFYASINESRDFGNSGFAMDGEVLRVELRADYGITDALELSVILPIHYTTSGFLDGVIDDFHTASGLGRSTTNRRNQYAQRITAGGQRIFDADEDVVGLADIPVQLKYAVISEEEFPVAVAVRGGIELPTGNSTRSLGSGGVDSGLGLLLEKNFEYVSLFANGNLLFFQRPRKFRSSGARVRVPAFSAAVGVEIGARTWWALNFQIEALSGAVRGTHLELVEKMQTVGAVGISILPSTHTRLRLAITEDITNAVSSDVAIYVGAELFVR